MKKLFEKLKRRWGVEDVWQVMLILFIFSITGLTALYARKLAFGWLGFNQQTPLWEEAVTWLVVVFPSYQIFFLLYGFILGQFHFVWDFEKNSLRRLKNFFKYLKSKF